MKKLTILSIFSVILFSLFSCTLNMEEYIVPEEEKGFDKPVVEETEMGTIKYQFQDNVQVLTERVQKYIADVREDSIIYFMDNLPNEWMPQVGNCLFGKITRMLPYGMSAKVLSVSKEGGLIKVVTTPAAEGEVFKQKEVNIDCDYVMQNIKSLDKEGSNLTTLNDSVIVDWSYNDGIIPEYVSEVDSNEVVTRADPDVQDESRDKTYSATASIEIPVGEIAGLYGKASLEYHVKKKIHFKETKGIYREEWTIDESYERVTVEVGMKGENIKEAGPKDLPEILEEAKYSGLKNYLNKCVTRRNNGTGFMNGASIHIGLELPSIIHVPFLGICYFDFSISGGLDITPSIFGKITFVHYHEQKKEGEYRYVGPDGLEYSGAWGNKDDAPIRKSELKVTSFEFCGDLSFTLGFTVSAEIGVGTGTGKGKFGIGFGGTATIAFTAGMRIGLGANWHSGDEATFTPIVDYYADLTYSLSAYGAVNIFGFAAHYTLAEYKPSPIWSVTSTLTPKLSKTNSKAIYDNYISADNKQMRCVGIILNFSQMFGADIYRSSSDTKYLKCRVYVDDPARKRYIDLYPSQHSYQPNLYEKTKIVPHKATSYQFILPVEDIISSFGEYKKLTIVPVFWGEGQEDKEMILAEESLVVASAEPIVSSVKGEQVYAKPSGFLNMPYEYSFALLTKYENTSDLASIGYLIKIGSATSQVVYFSREMYIRKNTTIKSGYYRTTFTYTSDFDAGEQGKSKGLFVSVTPFYITKSGKKVSMDDSRSALFLMNYPVEEHKPSWYDKYMDYSFTYEM